MLGLLICVHHIQSSALLKIEYLLSSSFGLCAHTFIRFRFYFPR